MGLINKYFKKQDSVNVSQNYLRICYKASEIITVDENLDIDSCGEEVYLKIKEEKSIFELDSLIIAFVLACYELRRSENIKIEIKEYWSNHNKDLKNIANVIIANARTNQKIAQSLRKYNNNDYVIDMQVIIYFHDRFEKYAEYIKYIPENDISSDRIVKEANLIQLLKRPFTNIFDIPFFSPEDYPEKRNEIEDICIKDGELSYAISRSYEYISNNIR